MSSDTNFLLIQITILFFCIPKHRDNRQNCATSKSSIDFYRHKKKILNTDCTVNVFMEF